MFEKVEERDGEKDRERDSEKTCGETGIFAGDRRDEENDIAFLVISGISLICSFFDLLPLPFDAAWAAILLCGVPIVLEAFIGLVTAFDIKADVLVSMALIASICIGEDFAAGEVAFIMQIGGFWRN